jgi:uncharacterized Zn-finger protein
MARKAPAKSSPASAALAPAGPAPEIVNVTSHRVACDGVGGALGHPKVFLELGVDGQVDCPYCDRRFVLTAKSSHAPGVYEDSHGH